MNRTMNWMIGLAFIASVALFGACSKDEDKAKDTPAANTTPTPNNKMPTPKAPEVAAELADDDLPVETDFEESAAAEISAETFAKELAALEQEISSDQ